MKYFSKIVILILITTILNSCGAAVKSVANNHLTEEKGAIPPNFGANNTTLVFITYRKSYNKYLKKNVKKYYTGEHEFVTNEEFNRDKKYKNLDKYRYVFDYKSVSPGYEVVTPDGFSKIQKVYISKLNEKRLDNQS